MYITYTDFISLRANIIAIRQLSLTHNSHHSLTFKERYWRGEIPTNFLK
jgi:hypothetical protein